MGRFAESAAALLLLGSTVQAQTSIDVSKITCEQYILFKVADPQKIAIWVSGYYHGLHNDTVLETQRLEENAFKVREFCRTNLKMPILEAVEKVVEAK